MSEDVAQFIARMTSNAPVEQTPCAIPQIGARVHLSSLLSDEVFLGTVIGIGRIYDDRCIVKLDNQEQFVHGVLYYESEPKGEIPASSWQICWPTGEMAVGEHEELC